MIEINNKHIVLMLLIIIIGVFIYNYDVYVIPKNEPLCKPVYVSKREISPEIRAKLNKTESEILKETFGNLAEIEYFESFDNLDTNNESIQNESTQNKSSQYDVPPKSFSSFVIPSLTTQHKIKVIDSVIKILSYIPTNYCESQIKQMVEYFAIIYETSPNLESFYKNITTSTKIKESPYNSKYSHLILFLIGKFDIDYLSCDNSQHPDEQCAMNEMLKEIINKKIKINNSDKLLTKTDVSNESNESNNIQKISPNYLSEQINEHIDNKINFNPKEVLNMIEQSKGKTNIKPNSKNNKLNNESKIILPEINYSSDSNLFVDNSGISRQYISNELYPSSSDVPKFTNPIINNKPLKSSKQLGTKKCNGSKCTYSCDSSYSDAISYLDSEFKPIEGFGNIYDNYDNYASFH